MVQTTEGRREAGEAALRLVRRAGTNVARLARDRSEGFLGEGRQTDGTRVLRTGDTQTAGAGSGMVTGPGGAVADAQVTIGRRLVLVQRRVDASVGELAVAGTVVQRLLRRGLRLALQASQAHGVTESVLLILCLLSGHLVQVHGQRVAGTHVQHA